MKWSNIKTIMILLLIGLFIGLTKIAWLFFNFYNILDLIIFLSVGYTLGSKVAGGRWLWGLMLVLPSMVFDIYMLNFLSYSQVVSGIGSGYVASLIIAPFAACIGITFRVKQASKKIN